MAVDPPSEEPPGRTSLRVLRICSAFLTTAGAAPDLRLDAVGGMQSHVERLTRALDQLGVVQDVVVAWRPGSPRQERWGDHATLHRVGRSVPRLGQVWTVPAARAVLRLSAGADLVHAHLGEDVAVLWIATLAARRRLPLVVTVQRSLRHDAEPSDPRSPVGRWTDDAAERWAERRADALVTLSKRSADTLRAAGVADDRLHVIPSGGGLDALDGEDAADAAVSDPLPAAGRPRVLFVGRLVTRKDPLAAVDAVARATVEASLVVVGDGPLAPAVHRQAGRRGILRRVHVTGLVPPSVVRAHLAHADLVVVPSVSEVLGTVVIEAMAAGVPVVATTVGGLPEVVVDGETGVLVPPRDPRALATAVDRLLGDPVARRWMGAAAAERAAGFDWPALAPQVRDLYAEVLDRRRMTLGAGTTGTSSSEAAAPTTAETPSATE
jgi:glycosyltransferase involved in cell wall biosynthesis